MTDRFDTPAKTLRTDTTNLFKAAPESMRAFQGLVTIIASRKRVDGACNFMTGSPPAGAKQFPQYARGDCQ
jgi:hypothetical protein